MKLSKEEKRDTYAIVMGAIEEKGIDSVRKIAFGEEVGKSNEAIAIATWINSRMFAKEMIKELETRKEATL
jgi:hypothetical protein